MSRFRRPTCSLSLIRYALPLLACLWSQQMSAQDTTVYIIHNNLEQDIPALPITEAPQTLAPDQTLSDGGTITIDATQRFQTMAGIGAAFSEIGTKALLSLPTELRHATLVHLFDVNAGAGFSFCRLPIGSSDFATSAYSYAETPEDYDLKDFSLERDRHSMIPVIKEALVINPNLALFASPWSPPGWMKESGKMDGGGEKNRLRNEPRIYQTYAQYLDRYLQSYRAEGIPICRICPQNETDCNPKYPGCVMTADEMTKLVVDHLAPAFKHSGTATEIWPGTFREKPKAPNATTCMKNEAFRAVISGLGIQYFDHRFVAELAKEHPGLRFMHTEADCSNGTNTAKTAQSRFSEMIGMFTADCDTYMYWNMALDEKQRSGWGWAQNSLITIDRTSQIVRYNPDFQPVSLVSRHVRPGDVRIQAKFQTTKGSDFSTPVAAFVKPDGTVTILAQNRSGNVMGITLIIGSKLVKVVLPAHTDDVIIQRPS